jgi:hypothetical protein
VANLPSKETIWEWEQTLGGWSPPFTGSRNHRAFTASRAFADPTHREWE